MRSPLEMPSMSAADSRPLLFTPLTIRGITLPNRVVISPMVQYHAKDGLANDFHVVHLGGFARGRAGLVFTEGTAVEAIGRVTQHDTGIWNDAQIVAFRRVVDFIHGEGAKAALQLAHSGRKGSMQPVPEGNGPLNETDFAKGRRAWEIV